MQSASPTPVLTPCRNIGKANRVHTDGGWTTGSDKLSLVKLEQVAGRETPTSHGLNKATSVQKVKHGKCSVVIAVVNVLRCGGGGGTCSAIKVSGLKKDKVLQKNSANF